jgi:hypothetical protein
MFSCVDNVFITHHVSYDSKVEKKEQDFDSSVVHDEDYFKRLQNSASHRFASSF